MKICYVALTCLAASAVADGPALGPTVTLRGGVAMPSVAMGNPGGCGADSFGTQDGSPCAAYNTTMSWFSVGGRSVHDALSYGNQFGLGKAANDWVANDATGKNQLSSEIKHKLQFQ